MNQANGTVDESASRPHFLALLPKAGFLRQSQILGDRRADPPVHGLIPISASQWWIWVRTGKAPAPIKLGPATTVWRTEDIRSLIERLSAGSDDSPAKGETSGRAIALIKAKRAKRSREAA